MGEEIGEEIVALIGNALKKKKGRGISLRDRIDKKRESLSRTQTEWYKSKVQEILPQGNDKESFIARKMFEKRLDPKFDSWWRDQYEKNEAQPEKTVEVFQKWAEMQIRDKVLREEKKQLEDAKRKEEDAKKRLDNRETEEAISRLRVAMEEKERREKEVQTIKLLEERRKKIKELAEKESYKNIMIETAFHLFFPDGTHTPEGDEATRGIERKTKKFPPARIKNQTADRTKSDGKRTLKQISIELGGMEKVDNIGAARLQLYLIKKAETQSMSTYKRMRAALLRHYDETENKRSAVIRALPEYGRMCTLLGREPSRRSSPVNHARRQTHADTDMERLLNRLSPAHEDAILLLRYTGARASEGHGTRLERLENGNIKVSIDEVKTGCRGKKNQTQKTRTFEIASGTAENKILSGVLERRGTSPCPYQAGALRAAWDRARKKEGLDNNEGWTLHSLRHAFASDYKRRRVAELRSAHGAGWREKLFGKSGDDDRKLSWQTDKEYMETMYGDLAQRLGHTCLETTRLYGRA